MKKVQLIGQALAVELSQEQIDQVRGGECEFPYISNWECEQGPDGNWRCTYQIDGCDDD